MNLKIPFLRMLEVIQMVRDTMKGQETFTFF